MKQVAVSLLREKYIWIGTWMASEEERKSRAVICGSM